MKAIVQERYGSPDGLELREVEKPVVGDDDVLVRVRAASVHLDVWHVVKGRPYVLRLMGAGFFRPKNPIPGTEMAGIVESVEPPGPEPTTAGTDRVDQRRWGRRGCPHLTAREGLRCARDRRGQHAQARHAALTRGR